MKDTEFLPDFKIKTSTKSISPHGGLFIMLRYFIQLGIDRLIDNILGSRKGGERTYFFSSVFLSLLSTYACGGDRLEDINYQRKSFSHPKMRIPSSDT